MPADREVSALERIQTQVPYVGSAPHAAGGAAAPSPPSARPQADSSPASCSHRGSASTSRLSSFRSPVCDDPIRRGPSV